MIYFDRQTQERLFQKFHDALAPGEELPEPPSEEEVTRMERALGVHGKEDDLPLEGE